MTERKKPRILIVDDDRQLRIALEKIFRKEGYIISTASNGLEAIDVVTEKEFDLIIADIRMPEKGGIELLSTIKKFKPGIPFIVMTAFGEPQSYYTAMDKGAFAYIHKPIKKDAILKLVRDVLETK